MSYLDNSTGDPGPNDDSSQSSSQKTYTSELEKETPAANASLYYRRENAQPERGWTVLACPQHAAILTAHHFHQITPGEHPDPEFKTVSWPAELFDRCAFCDGFLTAEEVERCSCQHSARECTVHGRGVRR